MPISRCSRPPPRTCWQSRRSDEIKTKLEETVKLLRLCRSLPLRLLTGRLLPCILFIYLFSICTNWKQRTAKGGGRYPESIPPETAGKTIGSAAGSAAHCSHRAGALLYHCTGVTQYPAVLSAGRSHDRAGHHVLHTGRGDEHDPHGRARGRGDHQKPEAAGDFGHRLPAGLSHHHLGAGPAGAGQSGARDPQHDPYPVGGGRRGPVSGVCLPANAHRHLAAPAAGAVLQHHLSSGGLCAQGVPCRGL